MIKYCTTHGWGKYSSDDDLMQMASSLSAIFGLPFYHNVLTIDPHVSFWKLLWLSCIFLGLTIFHNCFHIYPLVRYFTKLLIVRHPMDLVIKIYRKCYRNQSCKLEVMFSSSLNDKKDILFTSKGWHKTRSWHVY